MLKKCYTINYTTFFGHAHVTGIEILYIFHSSQKLLPTHFAGV
jgi:hypothetical protein